MEFKNNPSIRVKNLSGNVVNYQNRVEDKLIQETPPLSAQKNIKKEEGKIIRILDGIITFSVMALFFGLPLFFSGLTFQGMAFEKQIYFYFWVLIGLIIWAIKGAVLGKLKIERTPLDIPIIIFVIFYALTVIFSVDKWHSVWGFFGDPSRGLLSAVALVVEYYLLVSNFSLKKFKWIIGSFILSGILVSFWTLLAFFGARFIPNFLASSIPVSLLGSFSALAIFLGMTLPILIALIFSLNDKTGILSKIGMVALFGNIIINIFLLYNMSTFVFWPSILIGVGLFLVFAVAKMIVSKGFSLVAATFVFVAIVALAMTGSQQSGLIKINLPVEISSTHKLSWEISKESLKDKFFFGSGPANYGHAFSLYKPESFNIDNNLFGLRFYEGSGAIYEAMITIGGPGLVLLLLLVLSFVNICFYLLTRDKSKNKLYSLGMFCAAMIFLTAALISGLQGPMIIIGCLITFLAVALIMKESDSEEKHIELSMETSPKYALASSFLLVVGGVGFVFLFVLLGKIFVADVYAGYSSRLGDVTEDKSIAGLQKAISVNSKEGRYYTRIGQEYMILANAEILKKEEERDIQKISRFLQESISNASKGATLMSKDVLAVQSLAQVYENGSFYLPQSLEKALEWYQKSLELEPNNPELQLKLGQVLTAQAGQEQDENKKKDLLGQAKERFQNAVNKKKDFAAGYYYLGLSAQALNDLDFSIENLSKAYLLEGRNGNYAFNLGRVYHERGKKKKENNDELHKNDFEIAEKLFTDILSSNPDEINVNFSLASLYADFSKKDEAIAKYEKVLGLLSANDEKTKEQIRKMIEVVRTGNNKEQTIVENKATIDSSAVSTDAVNGGDSLVEGQNATSVSDVKLEENINSTTQTVPIQGE